MRTKVLYYIIFILSLLGLGVSAFLAYEYALPTPIICPLGGSGCETVKNSVYSNLLGIPLPYWGMTFYLIMTGLIFLIIEKGTTKLLKKLLLTVAISGLLFSIYLTALEEFVINAYCFWCVISAIITTVIFVVTVIIFLQKSDMR